MAALAARPIIAWPGGRSAVGAFGTVTLMLRSPPLELAVAAASGTAAGIGWPVAAKLERRIGCRKLANVSGRPDPAEKAPELNELIGACSEELASSAPAVDCCAAETGSGAACLGPLAGCRRTGGRSPGTVAPAAVCPVDVWPFATAKAREVSVLPARSSVKAGPAEPAECAEPAAAEPAEPAECAEPAEAADPVELFTSTWPAAPADPAAPTGPADTAAPADVTELVDAAELATRAGPAAACTAAPLPALAAPLADLLTSDRAMLDWSMVDAAAGCTRPGRTEAGLAAVETAVGTATARRRAQPLRVGSGCACTGAGPWALAMLRRTDPIHEEPPTSRPMADEGGPLNAAGSAAEPDAVADQPAESDPVADPPAESGPVAD